MIEVRRLAAGETLFAEVFRWHWLEWGVLDPHADETKWRTQLASRCHDDDIPFTLVALVDGEPGGCVSVCRDDGDDRFADRGPWVSGMVVVGPARNMGVGRALLTAGEDEARDGGCNELWVWTAEAGPFYERCGYRYAHRKESLRDRSVLYRVL
jgi:GNAT superfamily N-acetyltransferase